MKRPIIIALLVAALMLVLAGIAAVIFFTVNGGFPTNSPFDRRNISSQLEENKSLKIDKGKRLTLKVADDSGGVTVTGADVDKVQVRVVKTAYDSTQARAAAEVKTIKYTIEQTGNNITLKYELPKSMNFSNKVNTVDFVVSVPHEVTVEIKSSSGEVSVASTKGNVDIRNSFGGVTVENIEGGLSVQTSSGEVNASSIEASSDDIELQSEFGAVTLQDANAKQVKLVSSSGKITVKELQATGDITTKADFGDTKFENGSADSLSIRSSSGKVSLVKFTITKELKVDTDFGELELNQAFAGSYDLHTSSGAITVDGARNKLKAHTDFGGITVENAQSVTLDLKTSSGVVTFNGSLGAGPHMVQSDFGEIDLTLPADSKLNVDLSTSFGKIKSDLPITVTLNGTSDSQGDQIVGSVNGGGDQFTAKTSSGGVNLNTSK